jgi:hypothetical protein
MKRVGVRRPSPAMLVAFVALAVALGGTGYAAVQLGKNSVGSKQIKKNAVRSKHVKEEALKLGDLSQEARAALQGQQGPPGDPGSQGPPGPSNIETSNQGIVDIGTSDTTIDTLTVGPGSWMVFASVSIQTIILQTEFVGGRCTLEYPDDTVGYNADYEDEDAAHSLQLPVSVPAGETRTITLHCDASSGGDARTLESQITAIRTGTLNPQ